MYIHRTRGDARSYSVSNFFFFFAISQQARSSVPPLRQCSNIFEGPTMTRVRHPRFLYIIIEITDWMMTNLQLEVSFEVEHTRIA